MALGPSITATNYSPPPGMESLARYVSITIGNLIVRIFDTPIKSINKLATVFVIKFIIK